MTFPSTPPLFPPAWRQMADAAAAANRRAFALAHQARDRPDVDWHVAPATPLMMMRLSYLNDSRELANELADAAIAAHLRGDDVTAVERVRDGLAAADAVDRGRPTFLICHLVDLGEEHLALSRLQLIAIDARVGDAAGAVPRPTFAALTRELADDGPPRRRLRNALRGERVVADDTVRWLGSRLTVLRPMADLELARSWEGGAELSAAGDQPDLPAALAVVPMPPPPIPSRTVRPGFDPTAQRYGHLFTDATGNAAGTAAGSLSRFLVTDFRCRAERRTTAALLALRLYHLDHNRWPVALADLVPAYLPAVPLDPVAGHGLPLGYVVQPRGLPGGGDRVLLYWGERPASGTVGPPPPPPASAYADGYRGLPHWRDAAE